MRWRGSGGSEEILFIQDGTSSRLVHASPGGSRGPAPWARHGCLRQ